MGVQYFVFHVRDEHGTSHIPQVQVYSISILYTLGDNYELRRCAQTFPKTSRLQEKSLFYCDSFVSYGPKL